MVAILSWALFCFLILNCKGDDLSLISLNSNCQLMEKCNATDVVGPCSQARIVFVDGITFLVMKVKDSFTLDYATVTLISYIGEAVKNRPLNVTFRSHDFRPVLKDHCHFTPTTFNAFIDKEVLYMTAICGDHLAFIRTAMYRTRSLYTPTVNLLYTNMEVAKTVSFIGETSYVKVPNTGNDAESQIFESNGAEVMVQRRSLQNVNTTVPAYMTDTLFELFYVCGFVRDDSKLLVCVHVDDNVNVYTQKVDNTTNPMTKLDVNVSRNCTYFTYVGDLLPYVFPMDFIWLDHYLVNDASQNRNNEKIFEAAKVCMDTTRIKTKIIRIFATVIVAELVIIIISVTVFSACVDKKKRSELKKGNKND
ncbi:unnamed protein product [Bursaphelenchus okinawaensis]|uniref:Uncharacterized protein n=1 Tax=Bursaphelenchus okinawaensis TaxID=465554 RepID=A0A811JW13_9BILA|nr:unnamed protein product [Bursaphelenchus okinawaensis]CAG9085163.1 unnamed protein product [Bursaphelenchus okinawaensis]